MEANFKVTKLEQAKKSGYMVAYVKYDGGKEYTFVRRAYQSDKAYKKVVIEGYAIHYDHSYNVVSMVKEYETAGKKVTSTIKDSIKAEMEEKDIKAKVEKVEQEAKEEKPWQPQEVFHEKFGMILTCVQNNIPVYLAGPAGSGKNHTLEQVAKAMGLDFYFTNSVQQEYKLTGFIDAGGVYHDTEFYKAFTQGGLFFLDEMDASIPEVLVLLNAAIANGYFEFPTGKVTAHKDFRVVAAGNTVGSGADEQYTGRLVLDQATLDRFAIIEFGYSLKIELQLAKGNSDLVSFIEDIRKQADTKGIRATFSYRCITMVTKLEATGMDLVTIMAISIMKGLDKDTINTFTTSSGNKYSEALYKLKNQVA